VNIIFLVLYSSLALVALYKRRHMIFNAWLFADIAGCKYQPKFHENH